MFSLQKLCRKNPGSLYMELEVIFIIENAPLKLTDVSTMVFCRFAKNAFRSQLLCPKKLAPWVKFKL